jgi:hypothetical protein
MQSQLELQLRGGIASRELVLWSSDVLDSPNPLGCCGGFPSLSALSVIEFPTACCLIRPQRDKTPPPGCPNITNKQTMDNVDPPPAACPIRDPLLHTNAQMLSGNNSAAVLVSPSWIPSRPLT